MSHPSTDSIRLPDVLDALGDPIRLDVVRQLATCGGLVCGQFDALQHVSTATLSHHLRVLRQAGVIRVEQKGRFREHQLRMDDLESLFPGVLTSIVRALGAESSDVEGSVAS